MRPEILQRRDEIAALCRRFGVARLEAFGSALRAEDFDPATSDFDFLVVFTPSRRNDLTAFQDFHEALEALMRRPVDLVEREAVEGSRNPIRRRRILAEAEAVYG
jgi:predicted nucleotidyltransferase